MATAITGSALLKDALDRVNQLLPRRDGITVISPHLLDHYVVSARLSTQGYRGPVSLMLSEREEAPREIGQIYLARIDDIDFDIQPFESLALEVDDVVKAIWERLIYFLNCKQNPARYEIKDDGTIIERRRGGLSSAPTGLLLDE